MKFLRILPFAVLLLMAGCHFPMDYRTRAVPKFTTGPGAERIAVVGMDDRDYLKKGEIDPRYVGMFRDLMFAIPYKFYTASNRPAVDDLAFNVAKGLTNAGYRAESVPNPHPGSMESAMKAAQNTGASRILVVKARVLESDTMWRTELEYDFTFEVWNNKGRLLASNHISGANMLGGSALPSVYAKSAVPTKVGKLLAEGLAPLMEKL